MKRLFLASSGLGALPEFIGKSIDGTRLAFIPTAADPYPTPHWWIDKDKEILQGFGFDIVEVDLNNKAKGELEKELIGVEVIHIAGGNTFYLLQKIRESGFDELLDKLTDEGAIYVGVSAGSCVVAPDIEPVKYYDDPKEAPGLTSTKGLGYVDFLALPHFQIPEEKELNDKVLKEYGSKFKLVPLNDGQAILVENGKYKIVESK